MKAAALVIGAWFVVSFPVGWAAGTWIKRNAHPRRTAVSTNAEQRPAHEIAPEPKSGAAPLIDHVRYHVTRAYALRSHDVDHPGYLLRMEQWVAQSHLAMLLYGLHAHNADWAVTTSHDVLSDGEADEWFWQILTDLGIDPESIRPYPLPEVTQ